MSGFPGNKNDRKLWKQFKAGDKSALRKIYDDYFPLLYNYSRKFTNNTSIIEDSIQELFIDLMNKKEKLSDTDNIKLYLFKSVKRRVIRKLQRDKNLEFSDFSMFDIPLVEETSNQEELRSKLNAAMNKLSNQQQEIIYLKYFNFLNNKEIAEVLELNYQTVRNVLVTALKKLRKSMGTMTFVLMMLSPKWRKSFI